ncbi:MAG: SBBP repeat-containing protein, partial [Dehalococcoidales bacterium]|nr:SBBP repeat-containing protein [Dehalococcoidales bacterium]
MVFGLTNSVRHATHNFLSNEVLQLLVRLCLGSVLIISAITKLPDLKEFVQIVGSYNLLPVGLSQIYGYTLPWAELTLGIMLILGIALRHVAAVAFLMVLSFLTANIYAIFQGGNMGESCGCFGTAFPLSNTGSLVFDIAMILALVLLMTARTTPAGAWRSRELLRYGHAVNIIMAVVLLFPSAVSASSTGQDETVDLIGPASVNAESLIVLSQDDNEVKSFIDQALADDKTALLYFYSAACGYCQQQGPIIDDLESEYASNVSFLRIANNDAVMRQFDITGFPAIVFITGKNEDGQYYYQRFNGLTSREVLENTLLEDSSETKPGSLLLDNFFEPAPAKTLDPETLTQLEDPADAGLVKEMIDGLPLIFEENRGQTESGIDYLARGQGYTFYINAAETLMELRNADPSNSGVVSPMILKVSLSGANPEAAAAPAEPLPGTVEYYIGNDPSLWHKDIPTFDRVRYASVYPGIDVVYYGSQVRLEYDFVVEPGADPNAIVFEFEGAQGLEIAENGDLVVHTVSGEVSHLKPYIYQDSGSSRQEIEGQYVLLPEEQTGYGKTLYRAGFKLGAYDHSLTLIIDPVLDFGTYLGGAKDEFANSIFVDQVFNAWIVGRTQSVDFPKHPAAGESLKGSTDAFVSVIDPSGRHLLLSRYIGGSGDEGAMSLAVSKNQVVYFGGWTTSSDFPGTAGSYQDAYGGNQPDGLGDGFITRIIGAQVESTYIGGSREDYVRALVLSADETHIYAVGATSSGDDPDNPGDKKFPAKNSPYDKAGYDQDVFVLKIDDTLTDLKYAIPLGGTDTDEGRGIALDKDGNVYIVGQTRSSDDPDTGGDEGFPTTAGAFQEEYGGGEECATDYGPGPCGDGFIAKITTDETGKGQLAYASYLGGIDEDWLTGVAVDRDGNAYVGGAGRSIGLPWPSTLQGYGGGAYDGFVAKVDPAGSSLGYFTYLGGAGDDRIAGIALDGKNRVYVAGVTSSSGGFGVTMVEHPDYNGGASDAFVAEINADGKSLVFYTYVGGNNTDVAQDIAVPTAGMVYITGNTMSNDFPVTDRPYQQPYQKNYKGGTGEFANGGDAFVAMLMQDADGDSLPDPWEKEGVDINNDGTIDLDLPRMGAKYNHKDIFVEIDWMQAGDHDHKPIDLAMRDVEAAFAAAPVDNPDGTTGVNL